MSSMSAAIEAEQELRQVKCFTNNVVQIPEELDVLSGVEQPEVGKVCWRIMTKEDGDKRVVWDAHSIPQIAEAKKLFDNLVAEGMQPYRVGTNGERTAEVMKEFDPSAEEVIFLPMKQIVGG